MKTRILSAVVLVPILFVVVLALDEIVATALMALMTESFFSRSPSMESWS